MVEHAMHADALVKGLYVCIGQLVHCLLATPIEKVPGGHVKHEATPAPGPKVPTGQGRQTEEVIAPIEALKVPWAQPVQMAASVPAL